MQQSDAALRTKRALRARGTEKEEEEQEEQEEEGYKGGVRGGKLKEARLMKKTNKKTSLSSSLWREGTVEIEGSVEIGGGKLGQAEEKTVANGGGFTLWWVGGGGRAGAGGGSGCWT